MNPVIHLVNLQRAEVRRNRFVPCKSHGTNYFSARFEAGDGKWVSPPTLDRVELTSLRVEPSLVPRYLCSYRGYVRKRPYSTQIQYYSNMVGFVLFIVKVSC